MAQQISQLFRVLPGLPPYGPLAQSFPESPVGREGFVIEFLPDTDSAWVGNFGPGIGGYTGVHVHPNGRDVLVFSEGNAFVVDPVQRVVREDDVPGVIAGAWEARAPNGFILDRQGLAFERLSAEGLVWHTRRLSWDGFRRVTFGVEEITGEAGSPMLDAWIPFSVNIATGESHGGSFTEFDSKEWEKLAT
jgi:hypothetical protein